MMTDQELRALLRHGLSVPPVVVEHHYAVFVVVFGLCAALLLAGLALLVIGTM